MISIIIPTKDRLDLIKPCINTIQALPWPESIEIIVVENGIEDSSVKWARKNGCVAIKKTPLTFAQACNLGASKARGQWLLLCNNDILFTQPLQPPSGKAIIGIRLTYLNGLIQHAGIGFDLRGNPYHRWNFAVPGEVATTEIRQVPAVTFACAFIHRDIWIDLGGLDENFINSYEDVDFCLRARERGWNVWYRGVDAAIHLTAQTAGRNDNVAQSWGIFRDRWVTTGRMFNLLGVWPFEMTIRMT